MVSTAPRPPYASRSSLVGQAGQELQLLGVAEHGPGQAAGPGGERRVALLGAGAAEPAVVDVEQRLVGGAAPHVVRVAALPVEDVVPGGVGRVLDQAPQQADPLVVLAHQGVPELVGDGQRPARPDRVDEQRLGPVEGVDVARTVGRGPPPGRLHGAADLQGQLVEVDLTGVDAPLTDEPAQVAVRADVVEAVVVHPDVADVARHHGAGALPAELEEALVAGRVELQQRRAVLKALGPLGPAAGGVAAGHREHRRGLLRRAGALDRVDGGGRGLPQPGDLGQQVAGGQALVDLHSVLLGRGPTLA